MTLESLLEQLTIVDNKILEIKKEIAINATKAFHVKSRLTILNNQKTYKVLSSYDESKARNLALTITHLNKDKQQMICDMQILFNEKHSLESAIKLKRNKEMLEHSNDLIVNRLLLKQSLTQKNIEASQERDNQEYRQLREYLKERFGYEEYVEMMRIALNRDAQ